ncbi:hypothetical protein Ddc_18407 [Ditylenchus destructor]|nr:hypothetical protein Ddc_18407 [Ditylenchus destructor]
MGFVAFSFEDGMHDTVWPYSNALASPRARSLDLANKSRSRKVKPSLDRTSQGQLCHISSAKRVVENKRSRRLVIENVKEKNKYEGMHQFTLSKTPLIKSVVYAQ